MSKLRITPINISCSFLLAWICGDILAAEPLNWKGICMKIFLLVMLMVSDLFFRFFFRVMKRIWLVEGGFILFTALVIWLLRKS